MTKQPPATVTPVVQVCASQSRPLTPPIRYPSQSPGVLSVSKTPGLKSTRSGDTYYRVPKTKATATKPPFPDC